jgi:non-heme chloroperoxidase
MATIGRGRRCLKAYANHFGCKACWPAFQTKDLKKIDVPTLILHGDDDQIVPIQASALQSVKLIKGAELKIYKGAPHGMCTTRKEEVNADLLSFFQTKVSAPGKRAA